MVGVGFPCFQCDAVFSRKAHVQRHYNRVHTNQNLVHECALCGSIFNSAHFLKQHKLEHTPTNSEFTILQSAFKKKCIIYRKTYPEKMETLDKSFYKDKDEMLTLLKYEVATKKSVKASIIFHAEFIKAVDLAGCINPTSYDICLRTTTSHLCNIEEINIFLLDARNNAQQRIDDFVENGSGWTLDQIIATDVEIGSCRALNGSCNLLAINHLNTLKKIPVIEDKQQCFLEAIAYHFKQTSNKKNLQRFIDRHINTTIELPVKVLDIQKFEKDNSHLNIKINVMFSLDDKIYPLYVSKNIEAKHNINLLLFKTVMNGETVSHYSYIENLSAFLRKKYEGNLKGRKKLSYQKGERCPNCLLNFTTIKRLNRHSVTCFTNKPQQINLPEEGDTIKFQKFMKKFKVPLVGFFDFEAAQNTSKNKCETCAKKSTLVCPHKTIIKTIQEPMTYSLLIVNYENKVIHKNTYSGEDCVEHLIDQLLTLEKDFLKILDRNIPMKTLTEDEAKDAAEAEICHICEEELGCDKVRDHCHVTGSYLGMAHNTCNLNRQVSRFIPLFAHNFQGYDSHFIIQKLKQDSRLKKIGGLPHNTERFKTIEINSYVFLDSMAFLSASLSDLVDNLSKNENHPFQILDQMDLYDDSNDGRDFKKMLLRKGVYPYEFATGVRILQDTKSLPPIEEFYSTLTNKSISQDDYRHAQTVYATSKCENMLEYTELYCKSDCALLAEVFLEFREEIMREFKLDCW